MGKKAILLLFLLVLAAELQAEIVLPPDDFSPGWKKSGDLRKFRGSNLFDYIDGGAELFLEFGFAGLVVGKYRKENLELVLEIYQMENPGAALGIYLLKCGPETPIQGLSVRNSGEKTQFTLLKGSNFIHINNFQGDESLLPAMTALAHKTLEALPEGNPVKLFDYLPREKLIEGSERLVRGPYALQPIFTFGEGDILQLGGKIFGVVADYRDEKGQVYSRIVIPYPDRELAFSVFQGLIKNLDPYLKILERFEKGFIFSDYREKYGVVEVNKNLLDIRINLSTRPNQARDSGIGHFPHLF
jgi:hypothetical protein